MTVPELESGQRTQHCVPGKSKNPATPVREVLAPIFLVFFFLFFWGLMAVGRRSTIPHMQAANAC